MTDASLPAGRFTERDFRIGQVFSRAWSVFSGNFLKFMVVTGIASLPPLLIPQPSPATPENPFGGVGLTFFLVMFLTIVLGMLSQAIVLYGAFQDMRGRPVSLADCLKVGLHRFFPIVGLALSEGVAVMLASMLLIVPGMILYMMWFVATPVCVVEQLGPFRSLGRSRELTKGHRWKLFGLMLVILIPALIVGAILGVVIAILGTGGFLSMSTALATPLGQVVNLIWSAAWSAFYAVMVVVTYHDLRVAREGIDTEQIAAVFE
jgi:MFS family permease